jgi:acetylornithine deacetylase
MSAPNSSIDWLKRLIAFDTTSHNSNLDLIQTIADYCKQYSLNPILTHNTDKTKANLWVSIPDSHNNIQGGLILSGHTDVVPVTGQAWHSNPFEAVIENGKLYGRGSCDMKGFIACVLHALPMLCQTPLTKPIHVALSFDEEIGCLGAPLLLENIKQHGIQPEHCIIGEPTNMQTIVAHKGIHVLRCKVHGHSCHSSLTPKGVNAIEYAARLIVFITDLAETLKLRNDQDNAYDVPFSSLSTNMIQGGIASNIVPNFCEFTFDYRNLPHMNSDDIIQPIESFIAEHLLPKMQSIEPTSHIELESLAHVPALSDSETNALYALMDKLLGQQIPKKVAFTTEGGQFHLAGMHTVICGPGSIEQAHQPNEYIELSQLAACDEFLLQLIKQYQVSI